jgi:hypothetical protein
VSQNTNVELVRDQLLTCEAAVLECPDPDSHELDSLLSSVNDALAACTEDPSEKVELELDADDLFTLRHVLSQYAGANPEDTSVAPIQALVEDTYFQLEGGAR